MARFITLKGGHKYAQRILFTYATITRTSEHHLQNGFFGQGVQGYFLKSLLRCIKVLIYLVCAAARLGFASFPEGPVPLVKWKNLSMFAFLHILTIGNKAEYVF